MRWMWGILVVVVLNLSVITGAECLMNEASWISFFAGILIAALLVTTDVMLFRWIKKFVIKKKENKA